MTTPTPGTPGSSGLLAMRGRRDSSPGVMVVYPPGRAAAGRRVITRVARAVWAVVLVAARVAARVYRAARLTGWVVYVLARGVARHRRVSLVAAVAVVIGWVWLVWFSGWPLALLTETALITAAVVVVGFLVWRLAAPVCYAAGPGALAGWWWRWGFVYGPRWEGWALRHGLSVRVGPAEHAAHAFTPGPHVAGSGWMGWTQTDTARLIRVRTSHGIDRLLVALPVGLTPDHVARAADSLAHASKSLGARVVADRPGRVWVHLLRHDTLAVPVTPATLAAGPGYTTASGSPFTTGSTVDLAVPVASTPADVLALLRGVPVGVTETGDVWRVRLVGGHVLFAGTTGSGKSSLIWAVMHGLADAITKGLVAVTWLDPKGGMDATPARPMARVIGHIPDMADALEGLVVEMDARAQHLARVGARQHTPSGTSPHRVVIVDELATLTALAEAKTARRVEAALGALTSRGRGVGYTVVMTTVEPTKEVVRWRGLCAVRVAFRLDEPSQVDMVLGDGALSRGAACPAIRTDLAGVCYARPDGTPDPIRARVLFLSDHAVTALTRHYPAPRHHQTADQTADTDAGEEQAA
ncbi:MAG: FtsK/SpoIIIE domain-containing protein [Kineosporiaceae bacterium]